MGINAYPTGSSVDFDEIKSSIFNDHETQVRLFQHLTGWELSPTRSGYGSTRGKEPSSLTAYSCSSHPEKLIFKRWSGKSEPIDGGDIIEWTKHQRHCDFQEAMTYLGDQVGVTITQTSPPPKVLYNQCTQYVYQNADGADVLTVTRTDFLDANGVPHKQFKQRTVSGLAPSKDPKYIPVPYRLPDWFDSTDTLLIVEGEKCADALANIGFQSTTNVGGSGNWSPNLNPWFQDRDIVILPDNDKAGEKHVLAVTEALQGIAKSMRICRLQHLPDKGDVVDWLAQGNSIAELKRKIHEAPIYKVETSLDKLRYMRITHDEISKLANAKEIIPGLVVSGHLMVFPAPANAGKTSLFMYLAGLMAQQGYEVFYINADLAASDAHMHQKTAEEKGWTLIIPDARNGDSVEMVIGYLRDIATSYSDLSKIVIILDTLKKFTDIQNKQLAKEGFMLFRGLTTQNATVIALAHTNKYRDESKNLKFDGVGDVKTDVDELIYLESFRNESGRTLITSYPDKMRASLGQRSFSIQWDQELGPCIEELDELVDVKTMAMRHERMEKDSHVVKAIHEALRKYGSLKASDLVKTTNQILVGHYGAGRRTNDVSELIRLMASEPFSVISATRGPNNSTTYREKSVL